MTFVSNFHRQQVFGIDVRRSMLRLLLLVSNGVQKYPESLLTVR